MHNEFVDPTVACPIIDYQINFDCQPLHYQTVLYVMFFHYMQPFHTVEDHYKFVGLIPFFQLNHVWKSYFQVNPVEMMLVKF